MSKQWWEATSWREQQELIALAWEKNKDKPVPNTDKLYRVFNPDCEGKHDHTSYDQMICEECAAYSQQREAARLAALAPPTHEVYILEAEEHMSPDRFQSKEDGPWHTWINGPVDPNMLKLKVNPNNKTVYVNGCVVVALAFPHADETKKKIWHCAQGWQKQGML